MVWIPYVPCFLLFASFVASRPGGPVLELARGAAVIGQLKREGGVHFGKMGRSCI